MLWPHAMAGVVGYYARHPTTPRWPLPTPPLLIQEGDLFSTSLTYVALYITINPAIRFR
jgi:hypothetical protein